MKRVKSLWAITVLFVLRFVCATAEEAKQERLYTPIMLPENNICIRKAIELAFHDMGDITIHGKVNYSMTPEYYELGTSMTELIETVNLIHNFNVSQQLKSPVKQRRRVTIGPPYQEQIFSYSEFADILPTIQVSYREIPEPYESRPVFRLQVPPSVAGIIRASRKFVAAMNWTQVVIVYDFSDARYRHSVNTLEQHFSEKTSSKTVEVVHKARIQSDIADVQVEKFFVLSQLDSRILFLMVGVPGARLAFCQAYHMKLQRSGYVWILLEELPDGWASDKHNPIDSETNRPIREIDCTEEQLLSVTRGYIFISRGHLRADGVTPDNGISINKFQKNFDDFVNDPTVSCTDDVYYAYDAAWLSVKFLQHCFSFKTFEDKFTYVVGVFVRHDFITKFRPSFQMEGITGPITFRKDKLFDSIVREGLQSVYYKEHGKPSKFVALFKGDILRFQPDATQIMFPSEGGTIPSDKAVYFYFEYTFPESYLITIWTCVFVCILAIFVLTCLIGICHRSDPDSNEQKRTHNLHWIDLIILLGCIVALVSLLVYGLDTRFLTRDQYKNGCYGFLSTLCIGFSLTFGGMFSRTWWVYKSFTAPSVQNGKREFSQWFMLLMIGFFLCIDVIVLVVWATMSPFEYVVSNPTNDTKTYGTVIEEIVRCNSLYYTQFKVGMFAYKGVVLVFGVFLTWQTANRVNKRSTRNQSEAMAIYNTALVSIVGVVCVSLLEDTSHRHALYVIVTICVIICCASIVAVVFVPKIRGILYPFGSDNSSQGSTDQENNKTSFTKFTLELRRRVTGKNSPKYPSPSSVATSQISISTATSSLDSRKNMIPMSASDYAASDSRQGSFATEPPASQPGSLVSYNQSFSSPISAATILENSSEEAIQDIIADHPSVNDHEPVDDQDSTSESENELNGEELQREEDDITMAETGDSDGGITISPEVAFTNQAFNKEEVA